MHNKYLASFRSLVTLTLFLLALLPAAKPIIALGDPMNGFLVSSAWTMVFVNYGGQARCVNIRKTGGSDVFFPTRTLGENDTFIANLPSNIQLAPCGGVDC